MREKEDDGEDKKRKTQTDRQTNSKHRGGDRQVFQFQGDEKSTMNSPV